MTTWRNALSALAVAATVSPASAALIDYGGYSTDTVSSLDWLDVTATAGLTVSAVKAGGGGWATAGWRYASGDEVAGLFARYVGVGPGTFYTGQAFTNSLSVIRQLGVSISFNNTEGVQQVFGASEPTQIAVAGYFDDKTADSKVGLADLTAHFFAATPGGNPSMSARWVAFTDFWPSESASAGSGFGSFLVRDSGSVPEPQSMALALVALAGMGVALVRRSKRDGCAELALSASVFR